MAPEFDFLIRVDLPSQAMAKQVAEQISGIVNPSRLFIREVRISPFKKNRQDLDNQVGSLWNDPIEYLIPRQMADLLEVPLPTVYRSIKRLRSSGEIGLRIKPEKPMKSERPHKRTTKKKYDDFDQEVATIYLSDEIQKITIFQIAVKLETTPSAVIQSVRRLKAIDLIPNVRKMKPISERKAKAPVIKIPRVSARQSLKEIVMENSNELPTYGKLAERLPKKITKERVRQLLKEFRQDGIEFITSSEHKLQLKEEKARIKTEKRQKRQSLKDEVKKLLIAKTSSTEIKRIMNEKGERPVHIQSIINRFRKHEHGDDGEIPRIRRQKRGKELIIAMDAKVKELYEQKLSGHDISDRTGLDKNQVTVSLLRLYQHGEIERRHKNTSRRKKE